MLESLLTILAPVFIAVGLGFAWARLGRGYETTMVTELVTLIGAPCLIFATLSQLDLDPRLLGSMGLGTLLALGGFALIGALSLRLAGLPLRTFLPPLLFGNTGNMGLPLCLFAFGQEGLALAIVGFATTSILHFTLGQWLYAGTGSPAAMFRSPLIYSIALALLVYALDWTVPAWLANSTRLLGDFTIPLMLLTLGVSLARLKLTGAGRALAVGALKLGMGFGVGLAVASLLGLSGAARGVLVLQSAMPVAVFNYLFAQRYGRSPELTAGLVVASTLLSLLTLPLLLGFLLD